MQILEKGGKLKKNGTDGAIYGLLVSFSIYERPLKVCHTAFRRCGRQRWNPPLPCLVSPPQKQCNADPDAGRLRWSDKPPVAQRGSSFLSDERFRQNPVLPG